jgi:hypothetical protein
MDVKDTSELTDVDYKGEDVIKAMETVVLAMKEQQATVIKAKALKPIPKKS